MSRVTGAVEEKAETKLPRRDWILLPILSLATVIVIVTVLAFVAHKTFSKTTSGVRACLDMSDPSGVRGIPNCEIWEKNAEGPPVKYKFNSCGHRANMDCGPKPPGTYRIVMVGSSYAFGQDIPTEKTIASLLPVLLSQRTGRSVDLYNEGMGQAYARNVALHFDEALAAQPDVILWLLTKYDIERATVVGTDLNFIPSSVAGNTRAKIAYRVKQIAAMKTNSERLGFIEQYAEDLFQVSETGTMLMHGMYKSQSLYMKAALINSGHRLWYVQAESDPVSRQYLQQFEDYAAQIANKARAAGIPLVAALMPDRVQAAMLSKGDWSSDFSPLRLDDEIRAVVTRYGGTYVDVLRDFRNIPSSEQYYLPVDGHPDERWQPIVAGLLAEKLTDGMIPELKATAPLTAQERRR